MQIKSAIVSLYTQENISEKYLTVFYRKSNAQRTFRSRERILRNFKVHTAEQVGMFEEFFEVVHTDFINTLKKRYPSLTAIERTLVALLRIGLSEKKICRNTGLTLEELKRTSFIICKKMKIPGAQLRGIAQQL